MYSIDKNLDEIRDIFFITSYLFNSTKEDIIKSIYNVNRFVFFLNRIDILLDNGYILFFDKSEVIKVKSIIEEFMFKYSSNYKVFDYAKLVYHNICKKEKAFERNKDLVIKETLDSERELMQLPEEVKLDKEELIEYLKKDFDNYKLLLYPLNDYSNIDYMSFFATVNKMRNLNISSFDDYSLRMGFNIAVMHFENGNYSKLLKDYKELTLDNVKGRCKVYTF